MAPDNRFSFESFMLRMAALKASNSTQLNTPLEKSPFEEPEEQLLAEALLYEESEIIHKCLLAKEIAAEEDVAWEKEEYYAQAELDRLNRASTIQSKYNYLDYERNGYNPFVEDALDGEAGARWNLD